MSAKFNLFVTRESMRHAGGTKDYHVALVINRDTAEAIFMTRFGKADQNGQFKFEVMSERAARDAYRKKLSEKEGRGYSNPIRLQGPRGWIDACSNVPVTSQEELLRQFTRFERAEIQPYLERLLKISGLGDEVDTFMGPADEEPPVAKRPKPDPRLTDPEWGIF